MARSALLLESYAIFTYSIFKVRLLIRPELFSAW